MKKRILSLLFILLLVLSLPAVQALAVVEQSESFYVADYADVLSDELEQKIISLNGDLEYYCKGAQLVVVTVQYLDGMYSDDYAMRLFNAWGVGSSAENNGMLLLLATKENKAWLTVGAGIDDVFDSDMVNDYFDEYFWTPFDSGDFELATSRMFSALFQWYGEYYGVTDGEAEAQSGQTEESGWYNDNTVVYSNYGYYGGYGSLLGLIRSRLPIIILAVIFIVYFILRDRRRYRAYYTYLGRPMPRYHI